MVRSATRRSLGACLAHLLLMRACAFHWVQRWERAPQPHEFPCSYLLPSGAPTAQGRSSRLGRDFWPPSVRSCGAELQPESALPLPEPVEPLAGDPVAAALQVPSGPMGAEPSAGVGEGAAFLVLLDLAPFARSISRTRTACRNLQSYGVTRERLTRVANSGDRREVLHLSEHMPNPRQSVNSTKASVR
jgi:hypothetical protein